MSSLLMLGSPFEVPHHSLPYLRFIVLKKSLKSRLLYWYGTLALWKRNVGGRGRKPQIFSYSNHYFFQSLFSRFSLLSVDFFCCFLPNNQKIFQKVFVGQIVD
ncbi:Protein CBG06038 [Caenorhabditis briggsae]|uniref:Protein CBG06038 n=1 Tax=Caenorhabditis briggsae TaxID=6238 RepID=A8X118_CAEBR|nr:Protein CBG06038 [Caenorhabditis briggsae]CAP26328.2 Protein CBG06038 [Caenorhabditis briggsae]